MDINRVLLFSLHTDRIKVTIEAYFDEADNLVVEGYDIGAAVAEYWGDSDYEYSITIAGQEVAHLYTLLELPVGDKQALLAYLKVHYHTNTCFSELRNFLSRHHIPHQGFSWR